MLVSLANQISRSRGSCKISQLTRYPDSHLIFLYIYILIIEPVIQFLKQHIDLTKELHNFELFHYSISIDQSHSFVITFYNDETWFLYRCCKLNICSCQLTFVFLYFWFYLCISLKPTYNLFFLSIF